MSDREELAPAASVLPEPVARYCASTVLWSHDGNTLVPSARGEYVRHRDHAAQMQALADRLAECERERERLIRERDKAQGKCDQLDIELGDMMDRATAAEAALAAARKVIEDFEAHYPRGINPFLDDAARAARQWLSAKPKETPNAE